MYCRFLYYNGHICSRKPRNKVRAPREKNPSHHGVGWVHWGARRRFMVVPTTVPLHAIATAVAMVIVFKVSARVKVLTKRGAKAVSDCVGTPFPAESAPQILGRAKNRKPKSLHCARTDERAKICLQTQSILCYYLWSVIDR
jgi:hypothetical protein